MLLIYRAKTRHKMTWLSMRNRETKQLACYHQAAVLPESRDPVPAEDRQA